MSEAKEYAAYATTLFKQKKDFLHITRLDFERSKSLLYYDKNNLA